MGSTRVGRGRGCEEKRFSQKEKLATLVDKAKTALELRMDALSEKFKKAGEKTMVDIRKDYQWQNLLAEEKPMLLTFYSRESETCEELFEMLMDKFISSSGDWRLVGIDQAQFPYLFAKFEVEIVPTLMIFHENIILETYERAIPEMTLDGWIKRLDDLSGKK